MRDDNDDGISPGPLVALVLVIALMGIVLALGRVFGLIP